MAGSVRPIVGMISAVVLRELRTVISDVMPGATVVRWRRLRGGIATTTHSITVDCAGERRVLVLKQYAAGMWEETPGIAMAVHDLLGALTSFGVPAPSPIWSDSGAKLGVPALITTRMPGRMRFAPVFTPAGMQQAAATLAAIHALDPPSSLAQTVDGAGPEPTLTARDLVARVRHEWGTDPLGLAVAELLDVDDPPTSGSVLCHGDYHPGNLLWHRSQLSAVIDWDAARRGSPEGDVAWLRIHLALTGPPDAAPSFVQAYEAASGRRLCHLGHWDARAAALAVGRHPFWLPIYQAGGLQPRYEDVRQRLIAFIAQAD